MHFIKISAFAILATTVWLRPVDAQSLYTCGDGTVRGVQTITEMIAQRPVVSTIDPWGEPQQLVERPPDEPRQAFVVTVRLFNAIYTGEAFAGDSENFDPMRLHDGEAISACVNGQQMILDRGDGTDFRATLIRSQRVMRPTGTR